MKKVIAACIDRVLEFDTQNEAAKYLETLRDKGSEFRILHREEIGGKVDTRHKAIHSTGNQNQTRIKNHCGTERHNNRIFRKW